MIANSEPNVRSSSWLVRVRLCSPEMLAVWSIPVNPRLCAIFSTSLYWPVRHGTSPRIEARSQPGSKSRPGFEDEGNEDQGVHCRGGVQHRRLLCPFRAAPPPAARLGASATEDLSSPHRESKRNVCSRRRRACARCTALQARRRVPPVCPELRPRPRRVRPEASPPQVAGRCSNRCPVCHQLRGGADALAGRPMHSRVCRGPTSVDFHATCSAPSPVAVVFCLSRRPPRARTHQVFPFPGLHLLPPAASPSQA